MVPFCTSETPATSFPYPSAYFTPRVVQASAPLQQADRMCSFSISSPMVMLNPWVRGLGYEKSRRGGGGAWGASAILTRANESSILKCHVQVGEARHYATFFCSRPRTIKDSGPFSYSGVGCYAMTFKPGTFSSMNALMFFMASPFHAPPSASTRANFTPSLSLQRNTKELSGCSTSVKVR